MTFKIIKFHLQPLKVYVIFYASSCGFAIKADFLCKSGKIGFMVMASSIGVSVRLRLSCGYLHHQHIGSQ